MTLEQMAWLLMAFLGKGCRTCKYCEWFNHENGDLDYRCNKELHDAEDGTCIDGNIEWLKRETSENEHDVRLFWTTMNNVLITRLNEMPQSVRKDAIHYAVNQGLKHHDLSLDVRWLCEEMDRARDTTGEYQPEKCFYHPENKCDFNIDDCKGCPNHPKTNRFGVEIPI